MAIEWARPKTKDASFRLSCHDSDDWPKEHFFGVPYGTSHVVQMGQHQVVSYSHISHIVSCLGSNVSRFVKFLLMVESRRRMDAWAFCVH